MQCPTPINIKDPNAKHNSVRITVPCGKCGACKHNRRSSWSFRLKQENKISKSSHFVTLTYNDSVVPTTPDGELTLRKKDFQDFFKRLRKANSHKLRYYAVGEYGTQTGRPHYHAIIFNLEPRTLSSLSHIWGKGFATATEVTDARIHYVTKYHVNANHSPEGVQAEFALMSRRPGLGANYLENSKWHQENGYTHVINNGYKQALPRYYKEKIFTEQERKLLTEKTLDQQEKNYLKEIRRLRDLGIKDPERYIHQSFLTEAQKIKAKHEKSGEL